MVWILIVLALALAIGPILWLLPSKRDKLVSSFRAAARGVGLVVEVTNVPKLDASASERVSAGGKARDASIQCAAYRLPLPPTAHDPPRWRLLKSTREHRYLEGWTTLEPPRNAPPAEEDYWRRLAVIVDALPGGCIGVEATSRSIAWLGRERLDEGTVGTTVANIAAGLAAIATLHEQMVIRDA